MNKLFSVYVSYDVEAESGEEAQEIVAITFTQEHPQIVGRKVEEVEEIA